MSWFGDSVKETIDSLGKAIDDNVTSDEERLSLKNSASEIVNDLVKFVESAVSKRHESDMASDSWLSKNIRPLALAFLTVSTVLLAFLSIFVLKPSQVAILAPWIEFFKSLLIVVYGFYFGSRGLEKMTKIKQLTAAGKFLKG